MHSFEKDVLMICKGHYSTKFDSDFDAVKAYQALYTGSDIENLTNKHVYDFLCMIVKKFFTSADYYEMIVQRMMEQDYFDSLIRKGVDFKISHKYMANLFIRQLSMLRIKRDNQWLIDLSDYEYCRPII